MVAQIARCRVCKRAFPDWYGPDMLYANDKFINEITRHVLKHNIREITLEDAYSYFDFYGVKFKVGGADLNEQPLPKTPKTLQ